MRSLWPRFDMVLLAYWERANDVLDTGTLVLYAYLHSSYILLYPFGLVLLSDDTRIFDLKS